MSDIARTFKNKKTDISSELVNYEQHTPVNYAPTFNLDDLNLLQVCKNLEKTLNKPSPRTIIFKWLGLGKACLDTDTQRLVLEQINNLGLTVEQLASTKAKLYLSQEMIVNFINGYRAQADLANEEFLTKVKSIQTQRVQYSNLLERETVEIETLRNKNFLDRLKTAAEINSIKAQTRLSELQCNLLDKVVRELDLSNISPAQAFVLVKALNPSASAEIDWVAKEAMLTEEVERMRAENLKLQAQARKERAQADLEEWDVKEQMKK